MLTSELQRRYPHVAGAQPGYDCMRNGLHHVALATHAELYARAVMVPTPLGMQTYLVDEGDAYCTDWTWLTNYFPELTLEQIEMLGGYDITQELIRQALQITSDAFNFRKVLENLHPHIGDIREKLIYTYLSE